RRARRESLGVAAQSGGRGLGRNRVDEEAATPLEPVQVRELWDDLEMQVEVIEPRLAQRRGVEDEVERRPVERRREPPHEVAEERGEIPEVVDLELFERRPMLRRKDPALERKTRRERRDR